MILKRLANTFDFLQPTLYKAEKAVAGKQIPSVVDIPNRKKLSDFDPVATDQFDHSLWDGVLKKHIVDTDGIIDDVKGIHLLDYTALSQDANFKAYLSKMESADVSSLPEPEQLAFWMNAYNALCVSLLVKNMDKVLGANGQYSINNLSSMGNAVWDQEAGVVGGTAYSLNDIEHKELRGKWAEPAVHACIVCASASCPNLRQEAYVGSAVAEQMKDQVKLWMKNDTKGLALLKGGKLYLSRIFLWFEDDFGGWDGLRTWLPQFLEDGDEAKTKIEQNAVKVRFFTYNWQMNRKGSSESATTASQ
ncbi:hypothetical protein ACA910_018176 [Epithemia clementina (nom. ined.)]